MQLYECTFIMRQDIPSQEVHKISDNHSDVVKKMGGEILKKEYWGLRNLAYEISKNKKGHYVMLGLKANSDIIEELKRNSKINENVIKFLTLKVDKIDDEPSIMMQTPADIDN